MFGVMFFCLKNSFYILYSGLNVNPSNIYVSRSSRQPHRNGMASKTIAMWADMLCGRDRRAGEVCGEEMSLGWSKLCGLDTQGNDN